MDDRRIWQAGLASGLLLVGVGLWQGSLEAAVAGALIPVGAVAAADWYGLGETWRDSSRGRDDRADGARADGGRDSRGLDYGGGRP